MVNCLFCSEEIEGKPWNRHDPESLLVCTNCWFFELNGKQRKRIAELAEKLKRC